MNVPLCARKSTKTSLVIPSSAVMELNRRVRCPPATIPIIRLQTVQAAALMGTVSILSGVAQIPWTARACPLHYRRHARSPDPLRGVVPYGDVGVAC
jgi:hypothetical protein